MVVAKKLCTKCQEIRPRCEFYVQKSTPSGLHTWCKACFRKDRTERYWEDPDKSRGIARRSRENNLEAVRVRDRKRSKTPEHKDRQRGYGRHKKPHVREYMQEYRSRNKDAFAGYSSKRRAVRLSLPFDDYEWFDVFARDGWVCQICFESIPLVVTHLHVLAPQVDHIVPFSDPDCPGDLLSNVRATHRSCNASKGGFKP